MKPLYLKITHPISYTYCSSLESPPEFDTPWHYHPEYEIILIMNSKGTRYMGDNISNFKNYELVLVGPNLPHFWKEQEIEYSNNKDSFACVIHFKENFLGKEIFESPEGIKIKKLLMRSKFGLVFNIHENSDVVSKIIDVIDKKNFDRITGLLDILNDLSLNFDYNKLSSEGFVSFFNRENNKKINTTIEYAMNNFKNRIELDEVANSIFMSKSSFCRFFKKSTGKTYFDFIREIRIGYACKLILEDNLNITQIAYECGYGSISNFNRQFKLTKNIVPVEFKKQTFNNNVRL